MNNDYGMMANAFVNRGQAGMQRPQRPQQAGPYGGITAGQPRPMGG